VIEVRPLAPDEVERADAVLPFSRLEQGAGLYLVAWSGRDPVGHAHLALSDPPELQDVYVLPEHRRRGLASALTLAAEREAAARGHDRLTLTVSATGDGAQRLYRRLGYVDAGVPPKRVHGTITIRGRPLEVDDTLLTWEKRLSISGDVVRRTGDTASDEGGSP
jgi:[ribosomal protein S18]-alanine N-acetyltransferase